MNDNSNNAGCFIILFVLVLVMWPRSGTADAERDAAAVKLNNEIAELRQEVETLRKKVKP